MTRKRSSRVVRPIDAMSIYRLTGRAALFTQAEQVALNLPPRLALQSFIDRKAIEEDFHTLAAAVNVTMVCAEKIGPTVEHACTSARDALMRVFDRHVRTGQWGLDGPARTEIAAAVDLYEQMTSLLTGDQLKNAMTEVIQRIQDGHVMAAAV